MKNEEKAVKLFQGVTDVGDDLIEEAGTVRKRKKMTPWRGAAIAACLCLALVGTAAAVTEYANLQILWRTSNSSMVNINGYTIEFPVEFYPVNTFSQEMRDMAAADPGRWKHEGEETAHQYFDSWDDMQDFIGLELFRNPVLDSAEPRLGGTYPWEYHSHQDPDKTHLLLLPSNTDDGELYLINASGDYLMDGVYVSVLEVIYTEQAEGNLYYPAGNGKTEGDGYHAHHEMVYGSYNESCEESAEVYTTPNGLTATIVQTNWSSVKEEGVTCCAYFLIGGVQFVVDAKGFSSDGPMMTPEHTMEVLKTVLDGFQI